jgi:branched-chain amino acid transport system ATP-binding protein
MTVTSATGTTLLSVQDLSVRYGGSALGIAGVSLELRQGDLVALVGPNGGGKTSTLRGIAGFPRRDSGSARCGVLELNGQSITRLKPRERVRRGLIIVPERDKVFAELTVREQLKLAWHSSKSGTLDQRLDEVLQVLPEIKDHMNRRGGYLSGGQRQMVALATALCTQPKVLLIDEVTLGLAPSLVNRMADILRRLGGQEMALLIAEQSLGLALDIADRVFVLDAGRVVASGTPDELRSRSDIADAYLGRRQAGAELAEPDEAARPAGPSASGGPRFPTQPRS